MWVAMHSIAIRVIVTLCFAVITAQAAVPGRYAATDLGTLLEGDNTYGTSIDRLGEVAGYSQAAGGYNHAFLYCNGRMSDLGLLPGGRYSLGYAISAGGRRGRIMVTGYADIGGGHNHAFLYSDGKMRDLGTLSGGSYSLGAGINEAGQVAGTSETSSYRNQRAFLYSDGKMVDLGTLPGGTFSEGEAINQYGQVTGNADTAHGPHAFLYSDGKMSDLGTLPDGTSSNGRALNRDGNVTGDADVNRENSHAFLYSDGKMLDLGTLPGLSSSVGVAINRFGHVAGFANTPGDFNSPRAFLYIDGAMLDLNSLIPSNSGWVLEFATAINDQGQVTGFGMHNGKGRAFLLTPMSSLNSNDGGCDKEQR